MVTTGDTSPPQTLSGIFERSASIHAQAIALELPLGSGRSRHRLTYAELAQARDRRAAHLQRFQVKGRIVAVDLARNDPEAFLWILGILEAGAAYTCFDPSFPDAYARELIEDLDPAAIVTREDRLQGSMDRYGASRSASILCIPEREQPKESATLPLAPKDAASKDDLAYVIYTSGTTGKPKGVLIEHRSIVNLIGSDAEHFGLREGDRVAQGSSLAYDSSVEELWMAWSTGATAVILDDLAARSGPDLVGWLRRERITVFCPPPTLLRAMACENPRQALPALKLVYVGGEALTEDLARPWSQGLWLENGYGPTECTVTAIRGRIHPDKPIIIGQPVKGLVAHVLDSELQPVPRGTIGELCIGGLGLARGYWNRPDQTALRFPIHPSLGRIYRTGDLAMENPDGDLVCLGRLDAQVKVRGHRIELEAVDAALARLPGVRDAACKVVGSGSDSWLAAFLVADDSRDPPDLGKCAHLLRQFLPGAAIPDHFELIPRLPLTVGGKLDRKALPLPRAHQTARTASEILDGSLERLVLEVFRRHLPPSVSVSADSDFFECGGNSLRAAEVVSELRRDQRTSLVAVRDIYELRSARRIAEVAEARQHQESQKSQVVAIAASAPLRVTFIQGLFLAASLLLGGSMLWLVVALAAPAIFAKLGVAVVALFAPAALLLAAVLLAPLAVLYAALVKRLLIGRYRPGSEPVWGSFYLRHWIVRRAVRLIPWRVLSGSEWHAIALRRLGATIGERVHLHRGVDLTGSAFDLLAIGDDVTLSQDVSLRTCSLEQGRMIIGPITIGRGATLEVRSACASDTKIGEFASVAPLSFVSSGATVASRARFDGVPADCVAAAPARESGSSREQRMGAHRYAVLLLVLRALLATFLALPIAVLLWASPLEGGTGTHILNGGEGSLPPLNEIAWLALSTVGGLPITLLMAAASCRLMRPVQPGVIPLQSLPYLRVWLKTGLLDFANSWLSGTVFWPAWLRVAGMKIGKRSEISTIIDSVPELVEIGADSFLADGIYLGGPLIERGQVTLKRTILGDETFLGNHAVIPSGTTLGSRMLLGVSTVADSQKMRAGTSWFGHPAFELPRREIVAMDRRLTFEPELHRRLVRYAFESARLMLPLIPLASAALWYDLSLWTAARTGEKMFLWIGAPLILASVALANCALVLAAKWALLGRVKPGQHGLWSSWCCRWDFLYVLWGYCAHARLVHLEGTLLLNWYARAMGATIGRRVVLDAGFAQIVDPDMLHLGDDATVDALFQAHSFEDRVLKIDHVKVGDRAHVGSGTVMLYGADVGAECHVAPHSVIMKHERLMPGFRYEGAPTRLVPSDGAAPASFSLAPRTPRPRSRTTNESDTTSGQQVSR